MILYYKQTRNAWSFANLVLPYSKYTIIQYDPVNLNCFFILWFSFASAVFRKE
jgi:hypothetical protein